MTEPAARICLTFDVDGAAPWRLNPDGTARGHLTQESWGRFGIRRGLPRILGLLAELDVPGTFFVPGRTVESHPDEIGAIAAAGHEIGHHGHDHHLPRDIDVETQRHELDAALEAMQTHLGLRPAGYRAPGWDVTPETFAMVVERGFRYDSSFMGDDRPYVERHGEHEILELPVDWQLDDFMHFAAFYGFSGSLRDAAEVFASWQVEIESAIAEERSLVLTCHPEVVGRAGVFGPYAAMVRRLNDDPRIAFTRCVDLAERVAGAAAGAVDAPA
jgi:peptidoglycan/xylan/chitin deacetylase (PgdA/CDA1 family)